MARPANDLFPRHDELANGQLSIKELEAVAAGSILGDVWNLIKGEANDRINAYKTAAGMMVDAGRTFIHLL